MTYYDYFKRADANPYRGLTFTQNEIDAIAISIPSNSPFGHTITDKVTGNYGRLDALRNFYFPVLNQHTLISRTNYSTICSSPFSILEGTDQKHYWVVFKFDTEIGDSSAGEIVKEGIVHDHIKDCEGVAGGAPLFSFKSDTDRKVYFLIQHAYAINGFYLSKHINSSKSTILSLTEQALKGAKELEAKHIYNPDCKWNNFLVRFINGEVELAQTDFGASFYLPPEFDLHFLFKLCLTFCRSRFVPHDFKKEIVEGFSKLESSSPFETQRFMFFALTMGKFSVISTMATSDRGIHRQLDQIMEGFENRTLTDLNSTMAQFRQLLVTQIAHQIAISVFGMASSVQLLNELLTVRGEGVYRGNQENDPIGPLRISQYLKARGLNDHYIAFFNGLLNVKEPKNSLLECYETFHRLDL